MPEPKNVSSVVFYPGRICWGLWDLKNEVWILDCFDTVGLHFTEKAAQDWRDAAGYSEPGCYEIRKYVIPERKA